MLGPRSMRDVAALLPAGALVTAAAVSLADRGDRALLAAVFFVPVRPGLAEPADAVSPAWAKPG